MQQIGLETCRGFLFVKDILCLFFCLGLPSLKQETLYGWFLGLHKYSGEDSTEEVASSSWGKLFCFSRTLPRPNNCLSPTLQRSPFSTTARGISSQWEHTCLDCYSKKVTRISYTGIP
jgi:hypothetical protein